MNNVKESIDVGACFLEVFVKIEDVFDHKPEQLVY